MGPKISKNTNITNIRGSSNRLSGTGLKSTDTFDMDFRPSVDMKRGIGGSNPAAFKTLKDGIKGFLVKESTKEMMNTLASGAKSLAKVGIRTAAEHFKPQVEYVAKYVVDPNNKQIPAEPEAYMAQDDVMKVYQHTSEIAYWQGAFDDLDTMLMATKMKKFDGAAYTDLDTDQISQLLAVWKRQGNSPCPFTAEQIEQYLSSLAIGESLDYLKTLGFHTMKRAVYAQHVQEEGRRLAIQAAEFMPGVTLYNREKVTPGYAEAEISLKVEYHTMFHHLAGDYTVPMVVTQVDNNGTALLDTQGRPVTKVENRVVTDDAYFSLVSSGVTFLEDVEIDKWRIDLDAHTGGALDIPWDGDHCWARNARHIDVRGNVTELVAKARTVFQRSRVDIVFAPQTVFSPSISRALHVGVAATYHEDVVSGVDQYVGMWVTLVYFDVLGRLQAEQKYIRNSYATVVGANTVDTFFDIPLSDLGLCTADVRDEHKVPVFHQHQRVAALYVEFDTPNNDGTVTLSVSPRFVSLVSTKNVSNSYGEREFDDDFRKNNYIVDLVGIADLPTRSLLKSDIVNQYSYLFGHALWYDAVEYLYTEVPALKVLEEQVRQSVGGVYADPNVTGLFKNWTLMPFRTHILADMEIGARRYYVTVAFNFIKRTLSSHNFSMYVYDQFDSNLPDDFLKDYENELFKHSAGTSFIH